MNVTVEKVCLSCLVCDSLKQAFPGWGGDGTWGKLFNIWVPAVLIYKMVWAQDCCVELNKPAHVERLEQCLLLGDRDLVGNLPN